MSLFRERMKKKEVDFSNPPVAEVALDIQFKPIAGINLHLGKLKELFSKTYPKHQEQTPLLDNLADLNGMNQFSFGLAGLPEVRRQWYISQDDSRLLQLQENRLVCNWRKIGDITYVEYENLKKEFADNISIFNKYLADAKLGTIEPNCWEVTYINHIDFLPNNTSYEMFANTFKVIANEKPTISGVGAGTIFWSTNHNYPDDNKPYGKFVITAEQATKLATKENIVIFRLSLKGSVKQDWPDKIHGCLDSLDAGRSIITKTFRDLTTEKMHKIWGIK